jgi:hypothetical protein
VSAPERPEWWRGLREVEDRVEGHTIRWADGELHLLAHPDPEAEAALAALGGERCACLDVHAAWQGQCDDPAILTIGRRRASERVVLDAAAAVRLDRGAKRWRNQWSAVIADLRAAGDTRTVARLASVFGPSERALAVRIGFLRLLALDPRLGDRLQATVFATGDPDRHPARWRAALQGRAAPAVAAAGLPPEAAGDLPLSWLGEVWARGASVVGGRLVTAVGAVSTGPDGDRIEVEVHPPAGKLIALRGVDDPDDDWRFEGA